MKTQYRKLAISALMISTICSIQVSHAADTPPNDAAAAKATTTNMDCTLTDTIDSNENPGAAKSTFTPATPMVYLICDSDNIKKGAKADGVLTAVDTNNAAPANYKVGDAAVNADGDASPDNLWHANFNMSKPDKGWPAGNYKYEVFVDGVLVKSVNFTVK